MRSSATSGATCAGSTSSASVPFGILDNSATLDAPRELVGFELTAPGLPLGTGGLEIIDDDLVLAKFARGPDVRPNEPVRATVTETDVGTVEVRLPIRLVGPTPAAPITVDVVVDSLSADASDFTFGPAPLVFAAGETLKDLVITVLPDDIPEIDDVLLVAIQSPDAENLTTGPDMAVVTILNEIYEVDFCGFSYGFRPGRSQHDALDALSAALQRLSGSAPFSGSMR